MFDANLLKTSPLALSRYGDSYGTFLIGFLSASYSSRVDATSESRLSVNYCFVSWTDWAVLAVGYGSLVTVTLTTDATESVSFIVCVIAFVICAVGAVSDALNLRLLGEIFSSYIR